MKKILSLLQICLVLKRSASTQDYNYDYEDNIAMESFTPKSFDGFSRLVPQSVSGFLHRAGELFSDSDFGNKISVLNSEKNQQISNEDVNPREISSRKVSSSGSDVRHYKNVSNSGDTFRGLTLHPNVVQSFLGGKNVDDMQDELKNLLFGEEERSYRNSTRNEDTEEVEASLYDFVKYDEDEYDDDQEFASRRSEDDPDIPIAAELRQNRPYRTGGRRRPYRGRLPSASQGRPMLMRPNSIKSPIRDFRDPQIHKIPGRIQQIPDRFSSGSSVNSEDMFGSSQNSVVASVDCDFYTDSLCLGVNQYPMSEISRLLGANRRLSNDMIADVSEQSADDLIDGVSSNQELTYDYSHYYGNRRQEDDTHKHRDFAEEGGFLCPSEIKYAKPKRGKTAQGVWKDIVNVDDYTQTLRMEKCLKPGGSCSYVSHHYKSQCSQVYNYHRLLSWDKERGLHMDIYKVPTCCSCHIMGYSYVYPPLKKNDKTPAVHSPAPTQPAPPHQSIHSSVRPGSFVDFGSGPAGSSQFSIPQRNPSRPPPPQLTPDTFPSRPSSTQSDFDNFIPDFDPQEELQAFMNSIGDDFKDFNFERDRPVRNNQRPQRQPSRPVVGGFRPISNNLSPPGPSRGKRRGPYNSIRRGDGFGPDGQPSFGDETFEDPIHKYESIPLDVSENNFVKKKLQTEDTVDDDGQTSVNYAYHPIIDFFAQSYKS